MMNFFDIFSGNKTKTVLSFDGGGVRAIAGVIFLKKTRRSNRQIYF
jgi:hypothetical protein